MPNTAVAEKLRFATPVEVWRELDARRLNEILNHREVRPFVADVSEGTLDLSVAVAKPENILLVGEFGAFMCFRLMPGIYEVHTQILPEGRGAWAIEASRAGFSWMFTHTDAFEIVTRVPRNHLPAKGLSLAVGFHFEFSRWDGCRFNGEVQPVDIYSIRIQDWMAKASQFDEVGAWFHDRLQAEAHRLGITKPAHSEDKNHNRYVGVALEMVRNGQVGKGVNIYNRWAMIARHAPITLLSTDPPTVRMDIGTLRYIDGDIEVSR